MRVPSSEEVMNSLRARMPPRAACAVAQAGPAVRSAAASPEAGRLKRALGEVFLALVACVSAVAAVAEPHARAGVLALAGAARQREASAKGVEVHAHKLARAAWGGVEKVAEFARTRGAAYEGMGEQAVKFATDGFARGVAWLREAADTESAKKKEANGAAEVVSGDAPKVEEAGKAAVVGETKID